MAKAISESHSTFATWLLAGFSAAFTLILANIEEVSKFIETASIKEALFIFLYSMALAVIQKWLNTIIQGAFKGGEEGAKLDAALIQSGVQINPEILLQEIENASWYPAKFLIKRQYNKVRAGDLLVGGRQQFKLAQLQGFLLLTQMGFAIWSLVVLINGIMV